MGLGQEVKMYNSHLKHLLDKEAIVGVSTDHL